MTPTAPSFDLIACIGKAYQLVWQERRYLLRLAAIPFLLKIIFFTLGYVNGGDQNIIRLSIVMVPAWIIEGWMLSHFVRLVLLDERWPFRPSGNRAVDLPVLQTRYRGVMGGAVAYTLIQLIIGGWFALLMSVMPVEPGEPIEDVVVSPQSLLMASILIGLATYFFRFLWLYIAAAVGVSLSPVINRLSQGLTLSFRLIGLWLICAVPIMVVMQVIIGLLLMLAGPEAANDIVMVLSIIAKVIIDIVKNLLCAAAVAYAFQSIFGKVIKA